ncbi:hypothetical protein GY45DRAFT_224608 [Cubamyces sp. BRFM 1775]|nr:hypothetical protein GY45DRAFT_224608 [Cubamyces sp. BRFM 1775]
MLEGAAQLRPLAADMVALPCSVHWDLRQVPSACRSGRILGASLPRLGALGKYPHSCAHLHPLQIAVVSCSMYTRKLHICDEQGNYPVELEGQKSIDLSTGLMRLGGMADDGACGCVLMPSSRRRRAA